MKTVLISIVIFTCTILQLFALSQGEIDNKDEVYIFPAEDENHEGTWLTWPHDKTYGYGTRDELEPIWIAMTEVISRGENVHIIAYNETEKRHIDSVLKKSKTDMGKIDYFIFPTDDTWIRDNGPIFVRDSNDSLVISNWNFNGWGEKCPYNKDNMIPSLIGNTLDIPIIDIDMVLEGGSIETDGNGTCISTLSAVVNPNRNPGLDISEIENYLSTYMGFKNFIWLEGVIGLDITDFHIDGFVKMIDEKTILTFSKSDLIEEWALPENDYKILKSAVNSNGEPYSLEIVPLTAKNVKGLDYKGSYLNYYIANNVVLVPNYSDENDSIANDIISRFYPDREVIGIDITALFKYGGMIHCVTQQQPEE